MASLPPSSHSTASRLASFALAALAGMIILSAASPARAEADPLTWSNPIAPYRADPHVYLHTDGWYYFMLVTTNTTARIR